MNKSKGRILVVGQHYWPETFRSTDLCEGLVERGYEVDVLTGIPNYPGGKFFDGYSYKKNRKQRKNGVNIERAFEIPRGSKSNFRIFLNFASYSISQLFHIPKYLKRKYDRIICYQLSPVTMALMPIILSKLTKTKLYMYIGDFWPHSLFSIINIKNKFLRKFFTKFSYWHYRQAYAASGVFQGIADRLVSEVGFDPENVAYIPQAAEKLYEKEVYDSELEKRFKDGKFNIVFAGNINPAQAFDVVTKAAREVKDRGIDNVRYIILGEGMSKEWLINEVKNLDMEDDWIFEGLKPVEEVPKYQTIADGLLVALSKSELFTYGIPAKVQSYMAAGKPIIASMDGDAQKLINESGSGKCVPAGDYLGLADVIAEMATADKAELKKYGDAAKKYHYANFERNANLDKYIDFLFKDDKDLIHKQIECANKN